MSGAATAPPGRPGRRPATSKKELEHVALDIFTVRGFEETTVDDIARAAGIGRRTFFRYHASKNDAVWGDFDVHLDGMRAGLAHVAPDVGVLPALHTAILAFNRFPPHEEAWHRRRMALILRTPALQAHSTLRYARWREVVADFVAQRTGAATTALVPRAVAHAFLGIAVSAYEQWLERDDGDLQQILDEALRLLSVGFDLP